MAAKIAIVSPTFPPYRGGMGKVAEMDARQLAGLGYEVRVYAPSGAAAPAGAAYAVHGLRSRLRTGNAALVPEVKRLRREYPLVMLHYPFFGGAEPLAFCGRGPGKLAIVYHMDVIGRGWLRAAFALHTRWVMPRIMRSADRIIVTSFDYLRSSNLAPLFGRREGLFRELPPSVDTEIFSPGGKPPRLLDRYGLDLADRIVVFTGGLDRAHYFKGVPLLFEALATRRLAGVKAVLVGDGDLRPEFEARAAGLGLSGRVVFAGSVSEADLPDHYRLGDVFAFPSTDRSEAFGIAALEALATGLPVAASDLPGVRTIVREGETGFLTPPGGVSGLAARLADLLGDDALRQRLGTNARRLAVEEYAEPVRARRLGRVAAELLKP